MAEALVLGFFVLSVLFWTETRPPFDSGEGENPLKSSILLPPTTATTSKLPGLFQGRRLFFRSLWTYNIIRIVLALETRTRPPALFATILLGG